MVSLLPKWVNAAVCGILFFVMLVPACRFTGALRRGKLPLSLALMVVFALAFPWWKDGFLSVLRFDELCGNIGFHARAF